MSQRGGTEPVWASDGGSLYFRSLGNSIQEEIRAKVEEAQKEYFLREQLKIIRRELGEEQDAREMELARLEAAITAAEMPEAAAERAEEELARLRTTPVESGEYSVVRNYLDWLVALPWSVSTKDRQGMLTNAVASPTAGNNDKKREVVQ